MLGEAIKSSNKLPFGRARDLYESYPSFHNLVKSQTDNVLSKLSMIMKHAGSRGNILRRDHEEKFEMIVEANDVILERVVSFFLIFVSQVKSKKICKNVLFRALFWMK